MNKVQASNSVYAQLQHPNEIRLRCQEILSIGESGKLPHFDVRTDQLLEVASFVADVTRQRYPTLSIPVHSRWRHFEIGGIDRWNFLKKRLDRAETARVALDLLIPSVLLDAGAGADWTYTETGTGQKWGRSEGLALASYELFATGGFSSNLNQPLRSDASALRTFSTDRFAQALQVGDQNPLAGLEGRAELLRALGEVLYAHPNIFGEPPRIGSMYDYMKSYEDGLCISEVLGLILNILEPIWPERIVRDGVNLGDVWHHRCIRRDDKTDQLVPFHKLSQWLTYSLIEPLSKGGIKLRNTHELTGLAEYRNGGLLIDGGVLAVRDPKQLDRSHSPEDELIVEWRALTVALLDKLLPLVREKLGQQNVNLSLARLLEGGSWAAGRKLAKILRLSGASPIRVTTDGTVF